MNSVVRIDVDLAKNIMQLHGVDASERVVVKKAVSRENNREPCVIAMEACSSAHFWARRLREMGHDVRLIPPQFVVPYRKGGVRVKNDALDAEAICEAASRTHMRYVPVRVRSNRACSCCIACAWGSRKSEQALVNRLRGLLAEFGVVLPQGINRFRGKFAEAVEDGKNEIPGPTRDGNVWCRATDRLSCHGDRGRCQAVSERAPVRCVAEVRAQAEQQWWKGSTGTRHKTGE
ncbi:Mobile element protein [Candidatus Burkholderia humilis]|nr:Mobile element protein [Candidatus Burkholderia humilis]